MGTEYNIFPESYMQSQIERPFKYRVNVNSVVLHNKIRIEHRYNEGTNEKNHSTEIKQPKIEKSHYPNMNKYTSYAEKLHQETKNYRVTSSVKKHTSINSPADLFLHSLFIKDHDNQMKIILSVTTDSPYVLLNFFPYTLLTGKILLCRYLNKFKDLFDFINSPEINMQQLYLIACSTAEKLYMECINREYSEEQNRILNAFIAEIDFNLDIEREEIFSEWISNK